MGKSCYICTTPYQVIACISIVLDYGYSGDLYIVNQFSASEEYAHKIEKLGIFNQVILIDEKQLFGNLKALKRKSQIHLKIFSIYLHADRLVNRVIQGDAGYDRLFISSKALLGRLVTYRFVRDAQPVSLNLFDDGIGTYYNDELTATSKFEKALAGVLFKCNFESLDFHFYVYNPDLFRKLRRTHHTVFGIRFLAGTDGGRRIIEALYGANDYSIPEKVIVLEGIPGELLNAEGIRVLEECYQVIEENCREKVGFKAHPRSRQRRSGANYIGNNNIPMEYYYCSNNVDDKVIVTDFSTAAFTPKMLFDTEPVLIFLYRILEPYFLYNLALGTVTDQIEQIYTSKDRIIIPENIDELKTAVERSTDTVGWNIR